MSNLHDRSRARQAHITTPPCPPVTYRQGEVWWTPELIDWMRIAWDAGLSAQAIAGRMGGGVTKNSVIGKRRRSAGFADRPSPVFRLTTPEQETRIKELILLNRSPKDISRMTRATTDQIYRVRIREQLPPVGRAVVRRTEHVVPRLFDPPVVMPPKPVCVAPPRAVVVFLPVGSTGRCCWLDGDHPREFRQCEAMAVSGEGVPRPWSYCTAHRSVAYVGRRAA